MHKHLRTCKELLIEYETNNSSEKSSKKVTFLLHDNDQRDVYNITAPFEWEGETIIAGRVEARDSEQSEVIFFKETLHGYVPREDYPILKLQDPFVTKMGDELIVGGVEVYQDPERKVGLSYRTIFYRGKSIRELTPFAKGPDRMKDLRLLKLQDGRILTAVRPQGELGGRGKIGFVVLNDLEELTEENIHRAHILQDQFVPEEWGGCNELHLLEDGRVGILSHIACYDESGDRHYYATCFTYEPDSGVYTPMKMIAARKDFAPGEAKRPDLTDVIFSGGLVRKKGEKSVLYCGASDAEAYCLTMEDPFL